MVILENQIFKNAKNSDFFLQRYLNKKKKNPKYLMQLIMVFFLVEKNLDLF